MLYGKVIERKAKQQAFTESISRFRKSISGFRRGDKSISKRCESPFCPSMSSRTLAKLLNVSEFKARMIVKNLERLGVLWVHKQKPRLVSRVPFPLEFLYDLPGRRFKIRDSVFEQFGSRLEFLMFPVVLKRMTVRKFMKYIRSQRLVKFNAAFISM
jgi:hypothetical protein